MNRNINDTYAGLVRACKGMLEKWEHEQVSNIQNRSIEEREKEKLAKENNAGKH